MGCSAACCGRSFATGFTLGAQLLKECLALFGGHGFNLFALLGRQLTATLAAFTTGATRATTRTYSSTRLACFSRRGVSGCAISRFCIG